ncbi:hypothetical protein MMC26_005949 [Xylographa opegraphella]|nr:hypothetical protein [Xylographa opegraphella]
MDPLTIIGAVASVTQLATTCANTVQAVARFIADSKNVDSTLDDFHNEIVTLSSTLNMIEKAELSLKEGNQLTDLEHEHWSYIGILRQRCRGTLLQLHEMLCKVDKANRAAFARRQLTQVRLDLKLPAISALRAHISFYKQTLHVSLQTINLVAQCKTQASQIDIQVQLGAIQKDIRAMKQSFREKQRALDPVTEGSAKSSPEDDKILEKATALFDMRKCLDCLQSAETVAETSTMYEPDDQSLAGRLPNDKALHIEEWSRDITHSPAETIHGITGNADLEREGSSTLDHTSYDSDAESSADTEPDTAYSVREVIDHVIGDLEKDILQEMSTGDFSKAEKSQLELMQLLQKREERFKVPIDNQAQLLETLAGIHFKQSKFHEANGIYKRLLKDEGVDPDTKWRLCHSLGLNYQQEGRLKEAAKYAERAWDGRKKSLDVGNALTIESVALLIGIYEQKGDFRLAAALKKLYLPATDAIDNSELSTAVNESSPVIDHLEEWLLRYKFDPLDVEKMNQSGITPLILAVSSRQDDIVKNLLQKGANVESRCANRDTPLIRAVITGNEMSVNLLLDNGALVDAMARGRTPLHEAVHSGDLRMVKLLLHRNANVNIKAPRDYVHPDSVTPGRDESHSLTSHDVEFVWSPLFRAANSGRDYIVSLLIEEGADINARGPSELTALMLAVKDHHDSVTKVLLEKGASTAATDESGWTALHQAAHNLGREKAARLLLEHGAAVNAICDFGQSPLHIATEQRNVAMIRLLVSEYEANLELQDSISRTPLHLAIEDTRLGRSEIVKLLLELGADINAKNDKDQDALAAARHLQAPGIVRILKQWKVGLGKIVTDESIPISKLPTSAGESESSKTSRSKWSFHRRKNS